MFMLLSIILTTSLLRNISGRIKSENMPPNFTKTRLGEACTRYTGYRPYSVGRFLGKKFPISLTADDALRFEIQKEGTLTPQRIVPSLCQLISWAISVAVSIKVFPVKSPYTLHPITSACFLGARRLQGRRENPFFGIAHRLEESFRAVFFSLQFAIIRTTNFLMHRGTTLETADGRQKAW